MGPSMKEVLDKIDHLPIPMGPDLQSDFYPSYDHFDSSRLPSGYEWVQNKEYAVYKYPLETSEFDKCSYRLIRLNNGLETLCVQYDEATLHLLDGVYIGIRIAHKDDSNKISAITEHLCTLFDDFFNSTADRVLLPKTYVNSESIYIFVPGIPNALEYLANTIKRTLFPDEFIQESQSNPISRRVISHHSEYSSANLMKLVVVNESPLDDTCSNVVDSFSSMPNKNLPPCYIIPTISNVESDAALKYKQIPENFSPSVSLIFPVPRQDVYYATKPVAFISHFFENEAKGSFAYYIMNKGWAHYVELYPRLHSSRQYFKTKSRHDTANISQYFALNHDPVDFKDKYPGYFIIHIVLTESGFENYDKVVTAAFSYLSMIKSTKSLRCIFEQQVLNSCTFKFKHKLVRVAPSMFDITNLCRNLQGPYPRKYILSASKVVQHFDSTLINNTLEQLKITNCKIQVCSSSVKSSSSYKLPEELIKKCMDPDIIPEYTLPKENSFIPTKHSLKHSMCPQHVKKDAVIIRKDDKIKVTYINGYYTEGLTCVEIRFLSPLARESDVCQLKTILYALAVEESIGEFALDALRAGFFYNIVFPFNINGFAVNILGHHEKLPKLLNEILYKVNNFDITPPIFDRVKSSCDVLLNNKKFRTLDEHNNFQFVFTKDIIHYLTTSSHEKSAMLKHLDSVTIEQLSNFSKEYWNNVSYSAFVWASDWTRNDVLLLSNDIVRILPSACSSKPIQVQQSLSPEQGSDKILLLYDPRDDYEVSRVESIYFIQDTDVHTQRCASLLAEILIMSSRHSFYIYPVETLKPGDNGRTLCMAVSIKGYGNKTAFLERQTRDYVDSWGNYLTQMPIDDFEFIKNRRLRCSHFMLSTEVDALESITKQDIIKFYQKYLGPNSTKRTRLSIQIRSQKVSSFDFEPILQLLIANDITIPSSLSGFMKSSPLISQVQGSFQQEIIHQLGISPNSPLARQILDEIKKIHSLSYLELDSEIFTHAQSLKKRLMLH